MNSLDFILAKYNEEWHKEWSTNNLPIMERELCALLKRLMPSELYIETQYPAVFFKMVKGNPYFVGVIMIHFLNNVKFRLIGYGDIPQVGIWKKFRQSLDYNIEHRCYNMVKNHHHDINYAKGLPWVWFHYEKPLMTKNVILKRIVRIWNKTVEDDLKKQAVLTLEFYDQYISPRDIQEGQGIDIDSPRGNRFYAARVQTDDVVIYEEILNREVTIKLCYAMFCASNDVRVQQ